MANGMDFAYTKVATAANQMIEALSRMEQQTKSFDTETNKLHAVMQSEYSNTAVSISKEISTLIEKTKTLINEETGHIRDGARDMAAVEREAIELGARLKGGRR